MSQELERVYTIPLGKVLLSQSQHRAVRAINMIKEFAQHHMKVETIKIDEELSHQIWARGVRSPPRKIKVRMSKTDEGYVLVTPFTDDVESAVTPEKETKKVEDKVEDVVKTGDLIRVKLIKVDDQGRLDFSRKALIEKPEGYVERPKRPRSDSNRGGRKPFKKRRF